MATRCPKGVSKSDWALHLRVEKSVQKWRERLGLPSWPVTIRQLSEPAEDGMLGGPCAATINIELRTNDVLIQYYPKYLRRYGVDKTIRHEMLHWLVTYVDKLHADLLTEEEYRMARRLMESVIDAVATALGRK